jgi:hypothetical protein
MKLTGQTKIDFEKWLKKNYHYSIKRFIGGMDEFNFIGDIHFNRLPEAMQWGVFQDFAESIGFDVYVEPCYDWVTESTEGYNYYVEQRTSEYVDSKGNRSTMQEARNAAIEKLNEIINEK